MKLLRNCIALLIFSAPSFAFGQAASQVMEYGTSAGWWYNSSLNPQKTKDWQPYAFKGECPRDNFSMQISTGQGVIWTFSNGTFDGVSGDYNHHMMIHGLKCAATGQYLDQNFSTPTNTYKLTYQTFNTNGVPDSPGTLPKTNAFPNGWDWDPGYEKATCSPSTPWVTGISQATDASGIRSIQCAPSAPNFIRVDETCSVKYVGVDYNGTPHGDSYEWDRGYLKGYCGGGVVAGVSRNVPAWDPNYGGGLHAILCCGSAYI